MINIKFIIIYIHTLEYYVEIYIEITLMSLFTLKCQAEYYLNCHQSNMCMIRLINHALLMLGIFWLIIYYPELSLIDYHKGIYYLKLHNDDELIQRNVLLRYCSFLESLIKPNTQIFYGKREIYLKHKPFNLIRIFLNNSARFIMSD